MSVSPVIMPKLGLTMDEGRLIAWHKAEGDRVTEGEVLFEVETDKAAMEVPATTSGFVRRLLAKPDDVVPVAWRHPPRHASSHSSSASTSRP
jgi:pyruvate/2-oxoglutarate dehydrogenase complex dihydrolipoamide acyltransferase (E2) component